jgi:pimeloyl-ACP methyl ester carboxylesterase
MEQIYRIKERAPHTQLLTLPNCGHVPHRDAPQRLIEEAGKFIGKYHLPYQ